MPTYLSFWAPITLLLGILPTSSLPFRFGLGDGKPLYGKSDPGLTLLNASDFKTIVHNSPNAWMVEFYSSWCGHCIHFAPTFKQIAKDVQKWSDVISVAAIDCAQDENMPICRDYDIMGYPSLKFFPPQAPASNRGILRKGHSNEQKDIKGDMLDFVEKTLKNHTADASTVGWPVVSPLVKYSDLASLWNASTNQPSAPIVILLIHVGSQTALALDAIMDMSEISKKGSPQIQLGHIDVDTADSTLLEFIGGTKSMPTFPQLLSLSKSDGYKTKVITPIMTETDSIRDEFYKAVKEFVAGTKRIVKAIDQPRSPPSRHVKESVQAPPSHGDAAPPLREVTPTKSEKDIKRRRYTVFMSDLEKAMLYSLSHEAAQHATITGESLNALQDYIDALTRYFPARHTTKMFLMELRTWIMGHDDAARGVDLSRAIDKIKSKLKAFSDISEGWIGCAGSTAQYGNYPCGLWMMWHAMTVNQAASSSKGDDPGAVLKAMKGFVEHFFGCQECARHFLQMSENGKAIEREVRNADDAILWLWRAHNVVNTRLSGDISDDSVFPKERFPNRQHCSDCYNNRVAGSDGWREFRIQNVLHFLHEMYAMENFDFNGMKLSDRSDRDVRRNHHEHGLVLVPEERHVDADNFARKANANTGFSSVFSETDASLMFILYFVSGGLICLVCARFLARRRLASCLKAVHALTGSRSSAHSNPLVGKV